MESTISLMEQRNGELQQVNHDLKKSNSLLENTLEEFRSNHEDLIKNYSSL
jgi:hypothetical protein